MRPPSRQRSIRPPRREISSGLAAEGGRGRYRLFRGARLHAAPVAGGQKRRGRPRLYGPSPRHDHRRHRRRLAGGSDAAPVPRRTHGAGRPNCSCRNACPARSPRAVALGERREARPRGSGSSRRRRLRGASTPCRDAGDASALQRPLQRHADGRRLGIQPLGGTGGHPLARGRHLRRLGVLYLFPGRRERRVWSAGIRRRASSRITTPSTFSADRATFARRDGELNTILEVVVSAEDDAEVRRLTDHQHRPAHARHRGHLLCRGVIAPPGGRHRPSRLLETVRPDRICPGLGRHPGDAAAPLAGRA